MNNKPSGCTVLILIVIAVMLLFSIGADNNSSSSYSTRESRYDSKYGQGEFKKDLELYNSMKNAWPGN